MRSADATDIGTLLAYSRRVLIVPGYGLAVAQAQHTVVELAKALEARGVEVAYAIHPVAGRMPGHMNVLLAEADVPYESLDDLDAANAKFSSADVALVVGANDVVNPAARDDPASPLYGMPILNADQATHVVFMKRSMRPGFSGVDNALLYDPRTVLLFGDAKDSLTKLVVAVRAADEPNVTRPVSGPGLACAMLCCRCGRAETVRGGTSPCSYRWASSALVAVGPSWGQPRGRRLRPDLPVPASLDLRLPPAGRCRTSRTTSTGHRPDQHHHDDAPAGAAVPLSITDGQPATDPAGQGPHAGIGRASTPAPSRPAIAATQQQLDQDAVDRPADAQAVAAQADQRAATLPGPGPGRPGRLPQPRQRRQASGPAALHPRAGALTVNPAAGNTLAYAIDYADTAITPNGLLATRSYDAKANSRSWPRPKKAQKSADRATANGGQGPGRPEPGGSNAWTPS